MEHGDRSVATSCPASCGVENFHEKETKGDFFLDNFEPILMGKVERDESRVGDHTCVVQ
jgi:hypothetical protein